MKCPRCSLENSAAASFCKGCGGKLLASPTRSCAGCGALNKASASFCTACGAAFASAGATNANAAAKPRGSEADISPAKPASPLHVVAQGTMSGGQKSAASTSTGTLLSPQRIAVLVLGLGLMIGAAGVWLYGKRISETLRPATPLRSTSPAPAPVLTAEAPPPVPAPISAESVPPHNAALKPPAVAASSKPQPSSAALAKATSSTPQAASGNEPPRQKTLAEGSRAGSSREANTPPRTSRPERTSETRVVPREAPRSDPPRAAPASSRSTVAVADVCAAFRGLKLEQCRACQGKNAIGKVICDEAARMRYCFGKWGKTGDCPAQESFSQVPPP